jgi:hypothetical protein
MPTRQRVGRSEGQRSWTRRPNPLAPTNRTRLRQDLVAKEAAGAIARRGLKPASGDRVTLHIPTISQLQLRSDGTPTGSVPVGLLFSLDLFERLLPLR